MKSSKFPNFASKYFVFIYERENIKLSVETDNLKIIKINNLLKKIKNYKICCLNVVNLLLINIDICIIYLLLFKNRQFGL